MTTTTASVHTLHPRPIPGESPVELPYRKHETRPTHPHDLTEWGIEVQLAAVWDLGLSPQWAVRTFAPGRVEQVMPLVERVLNASAAVWDALYAGTAVRTVAEVDYDDALYMLARAMRGAA